MPFERNAFSSLVTGQGPRRPLLNFGRRFGRGKSHVNHEGIGVVGQVSESTTQPKQHLFQYLVFWKPSSSRELGGFMFNEINFYERFTVEWVGGEYWLCCFQKYNHRGF